MNHISNPHNVGSIHINKGSLADISELIRECPTAARVLLWVANNADRNQQIVTNTTTLTGVLHQDLSHVRRAIKKLARNGFIDVEIVNVESEKVIYKYIHDLDLYKKSRKKIWKVIEVELFDKHVISGAFLRITVNDAVIKCTGSKQPNIVVQIKDHLFYDTTINENEIHGEYWGGKNDR